MWRTKEAELPYRSARFEFAQTCFITPPQTIPIGDSSLQGTDRKER